MCTTNWLWLWIQFIYHSCFYVHSIWFKFNFDFDMNFFCFFFLTLFYFVVFLLFLSSFGRLCDMQFSFRQQSGPTATTNIEHQPSFDKSKIIESTVSMPKWIKCVLFDFVFQMRNWHFPRSFIPNSGRNNTNYVEIINNGFKIAFKQ